MSENRVRRRQGGASESRASARHKFENYILHHRKTLSASLVRLLKTPLQSLMTVLVMAIAMALPAALYVAVNNLQQLGGGIELNARMSVFLKKGATDDIIGELIAELETRNDVTAIVYMSPESALEEFRQSSGFGEVLGLLDDNPLPPAVLVQPSRAVRSDPAAADALIEWLKSRDVVDDVTVDLGWLQKLHAFVDAGRQVALGLGVVLAIGVVLVMGNTIRLAIASRKEEVIVVKLIGGTNGYVRRPFLYAGLWYGLCGGLMAWILVWLAFSSLAGEVRRLADLYQSGYSLQGPGFVVLSTLVLAGMTLGLLGAWLAVSSHLRAIEPE